MAGTMNNTRFAATQYLTVSMESGLDGRNNNIPGGYPFRVIFVSMESGLDGRNNVCVCENVCKFVSVCLNGVRPRWPEQYDVKRVLLLSQQSQWSPA